MRLFPDMLPFSAQCRIKTPGTARTLLLLAHHGAQDPRAKTGREHRLRPGIAGTLAFVKTITPAQLDGTEKSRWC